ncbi:MAG: glycosyltransferase [Halobacteriota archaeon]
MEEDSNLLVFHDSFDVFGGGERVAATIAKAFDARIVTTNVDPEIVQELGIDVDSIYDLGRISDRAPLGPIKSSLAFKKARFKGFDNYIVSGFWSLYASYRHKPALFYCHTPRRDFYDLKAYNIARQSNVIKKLVAWGWVTGHGWFDKRAISQVDRIVTNSENVRRRIKKYYRRESTVIYPPVATARYYTKEYGDFWLSVNRLYPEKRVDLQVEAFKSLEDENLVIAGGFSTRDKSLLHYHKRFADLPSNVKIIGRIKEKGLLELYARCKGVVYTPIDEDFGLVPVEAQASGKAVVGVNEGGLRETVRNGETGLLVPPTAESIRTAVQSISDDPKQFAGACKKNASRFDEAIFVDHMRQNLRLHKTLKP